MKRSTAVGNQNSPLLKTAMISIVNYGMGNIRSIQNALKFIGVESRIVRTPDEILKSDKLILPGVGSFRVAMENIRKQNLEEALNEAVLKRRIPILGICLGMQLLADWGEEDGLTKGLAWIRGAVKRFPDEKLSVKVPHIGFNTVRFDSAESSIYDDLGAQADFYFVHSYRMICEDPKATFSWVEYGEKFVAGVHKDNIVGVQFHPEKSQSNGLMLLKNFCKWSNTA